MGLAARSMMSANVEHPVAAIRVNPLFLDCMVIRERAGESKKIERALSEME